MQLSHCFFFYDRSRLAHSWIDLKEAISLGREALELCPSGHPGRPSSSHQLARYIIDRFVRESISLDLEETITLGRDSWGSVRPAIQIGQIPSIHSRAAYLNSSEKGGKRRYTGMIILAQEVLERPRRDSRAIHGLSTHTLPP